jgi:hypothetical protein
MMRINRWITAVLFATTFFLTVGTALAHQPIEFLVFDLDSTAGNQATVVVKEITANQTVPIQVYATRATNVSGFFVTVEFDTALVAFKEFKEAFGSNPGTITPAANQIQVGAAILGPTSGNVKSGDPVFLGTMTFTTSAGFTADSRAVVKAVALTVSSLEEPAGEEQPAESIAGAAVTISGEALPLPLALSLSRTPTTDPLTASSGTNRSGEVTLTATTTRGGTPSPEAVTWKVKAGSTGSLTILLPIQQSVAAGDSATVSDSTRASGTATLKLDSEATTSASVTVTSGDATQNATVRWQVPVPVELVSFTGRFEEDGSVALQWLVASQTNNYGWEVYRGFGTATFEKVGTVLGAGTSNEPLIYEFVDRSLPRSVTKVSYYLSQIDLSGTRRDTAPITLIVPTAVEDEEGLALPTRFTVSQNRPNPFNPETTIEYALPDETYVTIGVYDGMGQEIVRLLNGAHRPAGRYSVVWDGRDAAGRWIASGVYLYSVETGKERIVKKMLLVR